MDSAFAWHIWHGLSARGVQMILLCAVHPNPAFLAFFLAFLFVRSLCSYCHQYLDVIPTF